MLNCAVVPKLAVTVDGNLDEWKDVPGVTVLGKDDNIDRIEVLRRPWLALKESHPGLVSGRLKIAWDDENLYLWRRSTIQQIRRTRYQWRPGREQVFPQQSL